MMRLFPYDSITFEVPAPVERVRQLLARHIEPTQWIRFSGDHVTFEGSLHENGFRVSRIIHYRNSFLPVLQGTFQTDQDRIWVEVRMKLQPFVLAFLSLWFLGLACFGLASVAVLILERDPIGWTFLGASIGMALFGAALTCGSFWWEARKARSLLEDLFAELNATVKKAES